MWISDQWLASHVKTLLWLSLQKQKPCGSIWAFAQGVVGKGCTQKHLRFFPTYREASKNLSLSFQAWWQLEAVATRYAVDVQHMEPVVLQYMRFVSGVNSLWDFGWLEFDEFDLWSPWLPAHLVIAALDWLRCLQQPVHQHWRSRFTNLWRRSDKLRRCNHVQSSLSLYTRLKNLAED